ncbi:ricin-type beta-trefoil lectin domain protein [Streptosporangium sp. NPDC002721]|uniref:ricin-type beta-trefoil lectin domain protein n=1 Tax=Streptosporangium sp. NPDC002721 TaxID=3366188 RepID=UPI00369B7B67
MDRHFLNAGKLALVVTLGGLFINWTTGDVEFRVEFFLCSLILTGVLAWWQERDRAGSETGAAGVGAVVPVSFGVSRQGAVVLCVAGAVAFTLWGAVAVYGSLSAPDFEARGVMVVSRFAVGQPMVYGGEPVKRVRLGGSLAHEEPKPERSWDLQPVRHEGILHHRIVNAESRLCLDVEARLPRQSSHLTNSLCDETSDGQLWRLIDGTSRGRIASHGGELCIDVEKTVRDPGVALVLQNCSDRIGQYWQITRGLPPGTGSAIASAQNGDCVDVPFTGGRLLRWDCHGEPNQAFTYQEVPPRPGAYVIRNGSGCVVPQAGDDAAGVVRRPICPREAPPADAIWDLDARDTAREWQYWEIRHRLTGRCLRVEGESHEIGTELTLRTCDRTDIHQQWRTPLWARYPDAPRT